MPINGVPLMEYWISALVKANISNIYVNSHYKADILSEYLSRDRFSGLVTNLYEKNLLGTAGTIRKNKTVFMGKPLLLIHADNWTEFDIHGFVNSASRLKSADSNILMLTFDTEKPEDCGIVRVNENKIVEKFYEKKQNINLKLANGAIYFLDKSVVDWICSNDSVDDFSCDVIPKFLGRILTWHNTGYHKDIGSLQMLIQAQKDKPPRLFWQNDDEWLKKFKFNPIHTELKKAYEHNKK